MLKSKTTDLTVIPQDDFNGTELSNTLGESFHILPLLDDEAFAISTTPISLQRIKAEMSHFELFAAGTM